MPEPLRKMGTAKYSSMYTFRSVIRGAETVLCCRDGTDKISAALKTHLGKYVQDLGTAAGQPTTWKLSTRRLVGQQDPECCVIIVHEVGVELQADPQDTQIKSKINASNVDKNIRDILVERSQKVNIETYFTRVRSADELNCSNEFMKDANKL